MDTVQEFCLALLEGNTLEAKLSRPGGGKLKDVPPARGLFLEAPGRGPGMGCFGRSRRLPPLAALDRPGPRGICLRRFAHHELMAIELFAWALLAWPHAPVRLRRGWLAVLAEEQAHLGLYLDRLAALGTGLEDESQTDYFWRHVPAIRHSPHGIRSFLCAMGLTLEQANLDFTMIYAAALKRAGDGHSASILVRVHTDEIRHVRLAVQWLRRLARPGQIDLEAYQEAVPFPLCAARAKGRRFHAAPRRRAGLSASFIDHVRAASPRGTPGTRLAAPGRGAYLWPNLGGEEEKGGGRGLAPGGPVRRVARMWSLLFRRGSQLALRDGESQVVAWPESLAQSPEGPVWPELEDQGGGVAWWPSARSSAALLAAGHPADGTANEVVAAVHDKAFALEVARRSDLLPADLDRLLCCLSPRRLREPEMARHLERQVAHWPAWTRGHFTLKPRLGSSGRGRASGHAGRLGVKVSGSFPRLARQGGAILEPWLSRLEDFSVQMHVHSVDRIQVLGTTRQLLLPGGGVLGNRGRLDEDGGAYAGSPHDASLRQAAHQVARAAAARGFRGPCGVDSFTYLGSGGEERLRPIVELNARFTTGWISLGLLRRAFLAGLLSGSRCWAFLYRCPAARLGDALLEQVKVIPMAVRPQERSPASILAADSDVVLDEVLDRLATAWSPSA